MNTSLASIVVGSAILASAASGCRSTNSSDGAKPTAPPSATSTVATPPTATTPTTTTTATDPPSAGTGDESMRCPNILVDARRDGVTPDRFVPATDAEISAIRRAMEALPAEYRHEPALALAAGADGLDVVRRILAQAHKYLKPRGILAVEVGHNQDLVTAAFPDLPAVWLDTAQAEGKVFVLTREDLAGA